MAKASISAALVNKHLTKEEREIREETENKLKGKSDKIKPPKELSKQQKAIFKRIVEELQESGILGNLDTYILTTCAIALDRIKEMEMEINGNKNLLENRDYINTKDKYTKDFFRCCQELCLSPSARSKIGLINMNAKKKGEDPVLKALSGNDDG